MNVKNLIHSGDFVTPLPVGMPATLEFDAIGALKKVYWGFNETRKDVSDRIFSIVKITDDIKPFPFKLNLTGGTSWVEGIIVSQDKYTQSSGILPDCIEGEFFEKLENCTSDFHFFAVSISSGASKFVGAVNIRRWLDMNGFDVLPGFVAPSTVNEENIEFATQGCGYSFGPVAGYAVFRMSDLTYEYTGIRQDKVKTASKGMSSRGQVIGNLITESGESITVDYADLVKYEIKTNTMLVRNSSGTVTSSFVTDNRKRDKWPTTLTCQYCGKQFEVSDERETMCPEFDCPSRLYPRFMKMCKVLALPEIDYKKFTEFVREHKECTLLDILDTEEYSAIKFTATIKQALAAVVPVEVVRNTDSLGTFINLCNNNAQTVLFYIHHPDKIMADLNINNADISRLVSWLHSGVHQQEVEYLFNYPRMTLIASEKKFDGDPILRNHRIMITGKFNHGNDTDICAILRSYSATVSTKYSDDINCVIVGDKQEQVDGRAIRMAKAVGLPIFTESAFFNKFRIDEDLAMYLS